MANDNFFLTGRIQVGKSTLIRKVIKALNADTAAWNGDRPLRLGGFRTFTVADIPGAIGSVYITPYTAFDPPLYPANRIGIRLERDKASFTYRFDSFPQVFNTTGCRILNDSAESDLIIMDELGMMETDAKAYGDRVLELLDAGPPVLGVIKPLHSPLLDAIREHPGSKVFEVTLENRDEILETILPAVRRKLWRQRRDSAGALVLREGPSGREILLVRTPNSGWSLPKGHIEDGENEPQAAARETLEETGIKAAVSDTCLAEVPSILPGDKRSIRFYLASFEDGEARPLLAEIEEAAWVSPERATELLAHLPEGMALAAYLQDR